MSNNQLPERISGNCDRRLIQYGKDQKKVRYPIQDPNLPKHRGRGQHCFADLPGPPTSESHCRALAKEVYLGRPANSISRQGEGPGKGDREAQGKSRGTDHDRRSFKKSRILQTPEQKRQYVDNYLKQFESVSEACRIVGISSSSYYYRPKETSVEAAKADADVRDRIEAVQAEFPFYGYRRIHHHLERLNGITVNEKRILRIMRENGLKALIWRGFKHKTTDSNHSFGYAPNLLPGKLITGVNQVWVTDLTYIRIATGFVYLSAILDLFSRRVVGWAVSSKINAELCLAALDDAIEKRKPATGLIHHSDRGVQYACDQYRSRLKELGMIASMSAKGYCYDNAFMESWFKTLKAEEVYLTEYEKLDDVLKSIPRFIEDVYNEKRLHSSLSYFSPVEFEDLAAKGLLEKNGIHPVIQIPGKPSN